MFSVIMGKSTGSNMKWTEIATNPKKFENWEQRLCEAECDLVNIPSEFSDGQIEREFSMAGLSMFIPYCFWDHSNAQHSLNIVGSNICIWLCQL